MKRIVQTGALVATMLLCSQSQTFADMFFKDQSDELYEKTGSPLLRETIRAANEAKLREMIRQEVSRQIAERDRRNQSLQEDRGVFEEEQARAIRSQRDTERRQNEAYRQCVQSAGVRAYLDCH